MGFRRNPLRRLAFEDPEFADLEVDTRIPSVELFMRSAELTPLDLTDPSRRDDANELFGIIADLIEGWNLEGEDGTVRPVVVETFLAMDKDLALAIVNAWIDAVVGVPAPLPRPSAGGSPADGIPMTPIDQAS